MRLLVKAREASGDGITTFEYIHRYCFGLGFDLVPGNSDPFDQSYEPYALMELASGGAGV